MIHVGHYALMSAYSVRALIFQIASFFSEAFPYNDIDSHSHICMYIFTILEPGAQPHRARGVLGPSGDQEEDEGVLPEPVGPVLEQGARQPVPRRCRGGPERARVLPGFRGGDSAVEECHGDF